MIDEKVLIELLHSWQDQVKDKPAGLKEAAAYQRVINLTERLNAYESNQTIRQRIMNADLEERMNRIEKTAQEALDKVEKLTEAVGVQELRGSHNEDCNECLCYTCVHDDGGNKDNGEMCCDRHEKGCYGVCDDYEEER